jgi:predicted small lipoprotein YifL
MKYFIPLIFFSLLITACGSNKGLLERSDEDKALQEAVKKLNKNADNDDATEALPVLYKSILKTRLARIKSYES